MKTSSLFHLPEMLLLSGVRILGCLVLYILPLMNKKVLYLLWCEQLHTTHSARSCILQTQIISNK